MAEVTNCSWKQTDEDNDFWETSCGGAFTLEAGGPSENRMKFCCYCGLSINELKWVAPVDDEEDYLTAMLREQ